MLSKSTVRIGVIAIAAVAIAKVALDRVPALGRFKGVV